MTIRSVAGYCFESALWKILLDLSKNSEERKETDWQIVTPDNVWIEGEDFLIANNEQQVPLKEFYPPEGIENLDEAGMVWSLGALVCYASSGHVIFGGRGGAYQRSHPTVELPVLRKEHSALTPLVQKCLDYSPDKRIRLKDIHTAAIEGLKSSKMKKRVVIEADQSETKDFISVPNDVWPEEMGN